MRNKSGVSRIFAVSLKSTFFVWGFSQALLAAPATVPAEGGEKMLVYVVTKGVNPIPGSDRFGISEAQIRDVAEAGFNVVSTSAKAEFDKDRIREEVRQAETHGLRYLGWTRGKVGAGEGARLVWQDGSAQAEASPNSDVLWNWLEDIVLGYAEMSSETPVLFGVMVDLENYHRKTKAQIGNLYPVSYDEEIFQAFVEARGLDAPRLEPAQRKGWLEERKLHEAFTGFQIGKWRERCRALRVAVDRINPAFQFFILPAESRTPFMTEAVYPEWATERAPLALCSEATYGRLTHLSPQKGALSRNREHVAESIAALKQTGIPFQFLGGVDPIVRGADPEFCARNAVAISQLADGYWVFGEGPEFGSPAHQEYMAWFRRANTAIKNRDWTFQYSERETLHPLLGAHVGLKLKPSSLPPVSGGSPAAAITTRVGQTYVVMLEKDEVLRGTVEVVKARENAPPAEFVVADPAGREIYYDGDAQPGRPSAFEVKADEAGLYAIAVTAGKNHIKLHLENPHFGLLVPAAGVKLMNAQPPLYFFAQPDATFLEVGVRTEWHGKYGRMELYNPMGEKVGDVPLERKRLNTIRVEVPPGQDGQPWKILFTEGRPGEDLRDIDIVLGKGCARILASDPGRSLVEDQNAQAGPEPSDR